jgi:hypothetical protein
LKAAIIVTKLEGMVPPLSSAAWESLSSEPVRTLSSPSVEERLFVSPEAAALETEPRRLEEKDAALSTVWMEITAAVAAADCFSEADAVELLYVADRLVRAAVFSSGLLARVCRLVADWTYEARSEVLSLEMSEADGVLWVSPANTFVVNIASQDESDSARRRTSEDKAKVVRFINSSLKI